MFEDSESIVIDVVSIDNATENETQSAIVTITDDDQRPSVSLSLTGSPIAESGGVATLVTTSVVYQWRL